LLDNYIIRFLAFQNFEPAVICALDQVRCRGQTDSL
jgi:hypothetical protein